MPKARDFKTLGPANCPRCNAKAKLKALEQDSISNTVAIAICCDKCHGRFITGFSNRKQMERIERHGQLLKKYKEAKTPLERGRIMKAVERMARDAAEWDESIFNS